MVFRCRVDCGLEPGVLGGGMVEHEVHDHLDAALLSICQELLKVFHAAVVRVDGIIIGDVVAVVRGGWVDGHQPDTANTKVVGCGWVAIIEII